MFLGKGLLKICSKFTREHPCRSAISIKLQSNFIEIALPHVRSSVILVRIFRRCTHGTQLLQLKGADIFCVINSMCRVVYLIYIITSNFLRLIHTCSFQMNDEIKCIQQGIIIVIT